MRILIDMDGVLAATLEPWIAEYSRLTNDIVRVEDIKTYDFENYVRLPEIFLNVLSNGIFEYALPELCALSGLQRLAEAHDVRIVTYVLGETRNGYEQKLRWLARWCPYIDTKQVVFMNSDEKQYLDGDVLVEDRPKTIEQWLEKSIDRRAFIIDQPYNKDFSHPHCVRVSSLARVADILEEESR